MRSLEGIKLMSSPGFSYPILLLVVITDEIKIHEAFDDCSGLFLYLEFCRAAANIISISA